MIATHLVFEWRRHRLAWLGLLAGLAVAIPVASMTGAGAPLFASDAPGLAGWLAATMTILLFAGSLFGGPDAGRSLHFLARLPGGLGAACTAKGLTLLLGAGIAAIWSAALATWATGTSGQPSEIWWLADSGKHFAAAITLLTCLAFAAWALPRSFFLLGALPLSGALVLPLWLVAEDAYPYWRSLGWPQVLLGGALGLGALVSSYFGFARRIALGPSRSQWAALVCLLVGAAPAWAHLAVAVRAPHVLDPKSPDFRLHSGYLLEGRGEIALNWYNRIEGAQVLQKQSLLLNVENGSFARLLDEEQSVVAPTDRHYQSEGDPPVVGPAALGVEGLPMVQFVLAAGPEGIAGPAELPGVAEKPRRALAEFWFPLPPAWKAANLYGVEVRNIGWAYQYTGRRTNEARRVVGCWDAKRRHWMDLEALPFDLSAVRIAGQDFWLVDHEGRLQAWNVATGQFKDLGVDHRIPVGPLLPGDQVIIGAETGFERLLLETGERLPLAMRGARPNPEHRVYTQSGISVVQAGSNHLLVGGGGGPGDDFVTLWGSWLEDEQALVWMEAPAHLMIGLPGPGRAIAIEEGRRVVEFDFLTGQRRVIFPAKEMQ